MFDNVIVIGLVVALLIVFAAIAWEAYEDYRHDGN